MPRSTTFYPPKLEPKIQSFVRACLPNALKLLGVTKITFAEEDAVRLRDLTGGPAIIAPNHPSRLEPMIIGDISRQIRRDFYYVSALENFELWFGPIMQRCGAYSIARGTPDRVSLKMTRSLLAEQSRPVVLFPEGEVYHHNDLMLPLNTGVAQIGFWALADLIKLGKEPILPIVPIAVKYRFVDPPAEYINRRIARIEHAVGIEKPSGVLKERVMALANTIVTTLEKQYRLPSSGELPARIQLIKRRIIERGFAILGIEQTDSSDTLPEQMRTLFTVIREYSLEIEKPVSDYEERIIAQRNTQVRMVMADLMRIHDSIAITGHYVSDSPTYERLGELLGRMEDEVFGKHANLPQREAIVRVAAPIQLGDMQDVYRSNKRTTVADCTAQVAKSISDILESLAPVGNPIPESSWPI